LFLQKGFLQLKMGPAMPSAWQRKEQAVRNKQIVATPEEKE
jgi:hypothetical protein